MTEKLLQYLWNYKIFTNFNFQDLEGNPVEILDFGKWNHHDGPDFSLARLKYQNLIFSGNIELHVKSSDWLLHRHYEKSGYHNIILHVVFEHDTIIAELQNRNIPTIEIKHHISYGTLQKYANLQQNFNFIPCEKIFVAEKIPIDFHHINLLKKLDKKANEISSKLNFYKNDYEAVFFHQIAYAFGLKINAEIFRELAENIPFHLIKKISQNEDQLQALFFGKCGWLVDPKDDKIKFWKKEYDYLQKKYQISDVTFSPRFLRLRPPNFPTIRLSQLANLYSSTQHLFSKMIEATQMDAIIKIFNHVKASTYFDNHYNIGKISSINQPKKLSRDFVKIILLNAVLPIKYAYLRNTTENATDTIVEMYATLSPEKNTILENWKKIGCSVQSALESQSLLYHYQNWCLEKKCLHCSIGYQLLKSTE